MTEKDRDMLQQREQGGSFNYDCIWIHRTAKFHFFHSKLLCIDNSLNIWIMSLNCFRFLFLDFYQNYWPTLQVIVLLILWTLFWIQVTINNATAVMMTSKCIHQNIKTWLDPRQTNKQPFALRVAGKTRHNNLDLKQRKAKKRNGEKLRISEILINNILFSFTLKTSFYIDILYCFYDWLEKNIWLIQQVLY